MHKRLARISSWALAKRIVIGAIAVCAPKMECSENNPGPAKPFMKAKNNG